MNDLPELPAPRGSETYRHVDGFETFVGRCPEGLQALHADGNPENNALSNLRWGSPKENAADRDQHGRTCAGEKNGCAVLTENDVLVIRERLALGHRQKAIAADYGVHQTTISLIACNKNWRTLKGAAT